MRFCPHSTGPIHFIGIGGIGMSGIATILKSLNYQVTGSDLAGGYVLERLGSQGIDISLNHHSSLIEKAAVVVVSSAIREDNPELIKARALGLPIVKRAEMLAEIMRLRPSIAVAGTHGKTTTTSLIATLLSSAEFDPTIISGGIINAYGTNARLGKGEWVVAEADESDGTFVKLPATIAVVTNIEAEHMDFYGDLDSLKRAFLQFMENIPFYGVSVVCGDDPIVRQLHAEIVDRRLITYGLLDGVDVRVHLKDVGQKGIMFDLEFSQHFFKMNTRYKGPSFLEGFFLPMVGGHNMLNATAALIVGLELGLSLDQLHTGLKDFQGVSRRFSILGQPQGITVIDDYAHHPTEIRAVLAGARGLTKGRVIAVMQPHRYSRLCHLYEDFVKACDEADEVVVAPVYAAGEASLEGINHHNLASKIESRGKRVHTLGGELDLTPLIQRLAKAGDIVVCMGAGSISQWAKNLALELEPFPHKKAI